MNVNITHVIVHSPEQVRAIVAEAAAIADERVTGGEPWEAVFTEACKLLGARFTFAQQNEPAPFQVPAMAIPRGRH